MFSSKNIIYIKKKIIALILVMGVLFLTGCTTNPGSGKTTQKDPFIGGTDGLVISFQKDAPPAEVFDRKNFPFQVEVKLKNENKEQNTSMFFMIFNLKGHDLFLLFFFLFSIFQSRYLEHH